MAELFAKAYPGGFTFKIVYKDIDTSLEILTIPEFRPFKE